jgi:hypothetical protein
MHRKSLSAACMATTNVQGRLLTYDHMAEREQSFLPYVSIET